MTFYLFQICSFLQNHNHVHFDQLPVTISGKPFSHIIQSWASQLQSTEYKTYYSNQGYDKKT